MKADVLSGMPKYSRLAERRNPACKVALLVLIALLPACAPKKIRTADAPKPSVAALGPRDRLFPFGVYRHDVSLFIPKTEKNSELKFDFNGVVKLAPETIQMVALSHFGTTVFKLNEDLKTGKVTTEIFVDQMKKFESKLPEYYSILRLFLLARLPAENAENKLRFTKTRDDGLPEEAETTGLEKNATFRFVKYDQLAIPSEVEIAHPAYSVTIKVREREF